MQVRRELWVVWCASLLAALGCSNDFAQRHAHSDAATDGPALQPASPADPPATQALDAAVASYDAGNAAADANGADMSMPPSAAQNDPSAPPTPRSNGSTLA